MRRADVPFFIVDAPYREVQGFSAFSHVSLPPSGNQCVRAKVARVHLAAGETKHVEFALSPRDLSMVNLTGDRLVAAGDYSVHVGGGQPGTSAPGVDAKLAIQGERKLPE